MSKMPDAPSTETAAVPVGSTWLTQARRDSLKEKFVVPYPPCSCPADPCRCRQSDGGGWLLLELVVPRCLWGSSRFQYRDGPDADGLILHADQRVLDGDGPR